MTIAQALKTHKDTEADLLLSHVLGKRKEFLFLHPDRDLTSAQWKKFRQLAVRRKRGEPLAYILGYKYFCGLKFLVDKNVLIPRPESEWLVAQAGISVRRKLRRNKPVLVLDMGTGSGCLAISLAKSVKSNDLKITAADISPQALAVAKKNARLNRARVKFIQSDLFKKIPGRYDLIIANLPYVPLSDYNKLKAGLRYEPKLSLTDRTDAFKIYRQFLAEAPAHLKKGGSILLEIDPSFKKTKLAQGLTFYRDLARRWRYAAGANLLQ